MCGFSFICLLVFLPSTPLGLPTHIPPSFPILSLLSPSHEWEGSRHPLGEPCFQSEHVNSTLAQSALRSVSWSRATGSPPTIIDLAYSSASHVSPSPHAGLCLDKLVEDLLWRWKLPAPVSPASRPVGDHGVALWEGSSASPNPKHRGHLPVS